MDTIFTTLHFISHGHVYHLSKHFIALNNPQVLFFFQANSPQVLIGRFNANFIAFYACFTAIYTHINFKKNKIIYKLTCQNIDQNELTYFEMQVKNSTSPHMWSRQFCLSIVELL